MEQKKRIFSGIQPSGDLTLGSYMGEIRNWVALQEEYDGLVNKLSYLLDKKLNYKLNQLPLYINRRNWQEAEKTMTEVRDLLAALAAKKDGALADTTETHS